MAALAERRIIPHEELKARSEEKSEAQARAQGQGKEQARADEETGVEEVVGAEAVEVEAAEPAARPEHMRLLEALLFAASAPLDEKTLAARLPEDVDVKQALRALQLEYAPRGVNLVRINGKWTFRTAV